MDIVDANVGGRSDDDSWSEDLGWIGRGRRILLGVNPAQISAGLVIVGFALVLASQLLPWVRVVHQSRGDGLGPLPKTMGMVDEGGFVQAPYYLLWLVVFSAAGALVFLTGVRRMVAFAVGTGGLASQLLVVVPLLHRPLALLSLYGPGGTNGIRVAHAAGSYCLILAFVAIAAALVVGVDGRIFPGLPDRAAASLLTIEAPVASMHEALAGSVPARDHADIDIDWSPNRVAVSSEEVAVDEPDYRPVHRDHSMYRRPETPTEAAELPS